MVQCDTVRVQYGTVNSEEDDTVVSYILYPGTVLYSRLISFSGGTLTFLRGVQGNPNFFPILVQGDAVHGMWPI